jgi:hypothetical protein
MIAFGLGIFTGAKVGRTKYNGIIRITETEKGLVYSLELEEHPELLVNQEEARFKIVSPSYEKMVSQE